MTEEDEDDFKNKFICQFCDSNTFRDDCHSTAEYRRPAHQKFNINVTKKQGSLNPFVFPTFGD